jgi:MYXO-CTERM domain-containing protein
VNPAKNSYFWAISSFIIMAACNAHADTVLYTLDNVILDDNNTEMTGTFSWTFDIGDFENGVGIFIFLDIPFTLHDHTDLDAVFDIGSSIEITLEGSVHDDGVDITLFLLQPLTPTTSSSIDLVRSKYEIGGNGFHDGLFLSGSIQVVPEPTPTALYLAAMTVLALLARVRRRRGAA